MRAGRCDNWDFAGQRRIFFLNLEYCLDDWRAFTKKKASSD